MQKFITRFPFISKIANAVEDYRLGIRTGGIINTDKPGAVHYASLDHSLTREVLDRLRLSMEDEFIDIGCGKGRVLAVAAAYPVKSIIGVEYEPALVNMAKLNMAKLNIAKRIKISIYQGAAEDFEYSAITVAYAFNPVEPDILDPILAKIALDRMKRPFRMAYVMESPAQRAIFASHSWLERYDGFTNTAGHVVSFYQSIA
jgi:SAM-dependent methyltransferase